MGKYNEFENLRVAGVRYADMRGYSYDRSDVTARGLANAYAQTLGTVFITESKPLEVEIVVAEVGAEPADDQIYRLTYDGTVADEHGFVVMGGQAEQLGRKVKEGGVPTSPWGRRCGSPWRRSARATARRRARSRRPSSRSPSWSATGRAARSGG
nr:hypothetical protein GCM10025730_54370 [Promicromonospora thailandica]